MNIVELLRRQHEEVRDILERMIAEDDRKESRTLMTQLGKAMRLHMAIEEKVVYPAATRAFEGDEDDEETVLESYEEHALARYCLETLEGTSFNDKRFVVRAKVVREVFDKHVEEEENEMFPELEGKLGQDGMEKLGDQVERRMGQLESEAAPGAARRTRAERSTGRRTAAQREAGGAKGRRGGQGARGSGGARSTRSTPRTGRGAGSPSRSGSRKGTSRGSSSKQGGRSQEGNGRKPRRGESTSRS